MMPRLPVWPTLFTAIALAIMVGLGFWQLDRRAWKHGLIAARTAGAQAAAVPLPDRIEDPAAWEYRKVAVAGRLLHEREMYLTGRSYRDRPGFQVITPLRLPDGSHLLVNRGWVPADRRDPATRAAGQPAGDVAVEGLVRLSTVPGYFTPANQPDRNLWFYPDVGEMARAAGLAAVMPVFVEAGPAENRGGLPVGGQTRLDLADNHLQYALTWFSLAATLAVIYVLFCLRRTRPA